MRPEAPEGLPVRVQLGDLGPYPGLLSHTFEEPVIDFDAERVRLAERPGWRVEVTGVPYRDGYALATLGEPDTDADAGLVTPVEPILTCDGWPQRYTGKAWLSDLQYNLGPRLPDMPPLGRGEWLSFTLVGIGDARSIRPV